MNEYVEPVKLQEKMKWVLKRKNLFWPKMQRYAKSRNIELVTSTLYYAQENGQVEATNKNLIDLICKHTKQNPKSWHETLTQVLWAYRRGFLEPHVRST